MVLGVYPYQGRTSFDVFHFDVGQGDCILLKGQLTNLLVDCGTKYNTGRYKNIPFFIERILDHHQSTIFLISHFHDDHYNLFQYFYSPNLLFSEIYVPRLPLRVNRHVGKAIFLYLMASVIVNFRGSRILPQIFRRFGRPASTLQKGDKINAIGQKMNVIWPDLSSNLLSTKEVYERSNKIITNLQPLLERYDIQIDNYIDQNDTLELLSILNEFINRDIHSEEIERILNELEVEFKYLNNLISLVLITYVKRKDRIILLGDVPKKVIDILNINRRPEYRVIKAAHHGTEFGNSLRGLNNDILLISRNCGEYKALRKVNYGYYCEMNNRLILSTENVKSSIIFRT